VPLRLQSTPRVGGGSAFFVRRLLAYIMTKAFILTEIKRIAAENNGVAPGRLRFTALTGIKASDWSGRFWVRWNDAIAEAGLQPNQMQAAHDSSGLLKLLVALISRLQKFPTVDLRNSPLPDFRRPQRFGTG